jgi:hypothetical protein
MATTAEYKCANKSCGKVFTARTADRKRGWARFCSKSCKAIKQEAITGQHAQHLLHKKVAEYANEYGENPHFDLRGNYDGFTGLDPEHDCNKGD